MSPVYDTTVSQFMAALQMFQLITMIKLLVDVSDIKRKLKMK